MTFGHFSFGFMPLRTKDRVDVTSEKYRYPGRKIPKGLKGGEIHKRASPRKSSCAPSAQDIKSKNDRREFFFLLKNEGKLLLQGCELPFVMGHDETNRFNYFSMMPSMRMEKYGAERMVDSSNAPSLMHSTTLP